MSIERLKQVAVFLRERGDVAQAETLEKAIVEIASGRLDIAKVGVTLDYRLDKFDGEYEPGKEPVETITGREDLLTGESIP